MAEVYHNNIIDIDLESRTLFRSFLNHTIGSGDNNANWYGVRVFRKGEPIALSGCSVQGLFMPASGAAILISDGTHTWVSGNEAAVLLPQACYNVKGQFTLTIKIIGTNPYSITDTVRIIDGVVADTYSENPVAPTAAVPTYQEILAVYDQMVAAKDGSVRFDIDQTLTAAQMTQARGNIAAASESDVSDLNSAINKKAHLLDVSHAVGKPIAEYIMDSYIKTNGDSVDVTDILPSSSHMACAVIDATEGEIFTISGHGGSSGRLWCFVSANGTALSKSYDNITQTYTGAAPSGTAKLVVNVMPDVPYYVVKGEPLTDIIKNNIIDTAEKLSGIINVESFAENAINMKYVITRGYYQSTDGLDGTDIRYAKTSKLSKFGGKTVHITVASEYTLSVRFWDQNGDFDSSKNTSYLSDAFVYVPDGWTIALNFRKPAQTDLNDSDYTAISSSLHMYTSGNEIKQTTISTGTNFNTLKATGTYRIPSNITGNTNNPTGDYGRLIVVNSLDNYTCVQFYVSYKNAIYCRVLTNAQSDIWTDWVTLANGNTTFLNRSPVLNSDNVVDFNLMRTQGRYGLSDSQASTAANSPSPYQGHLLVFAGNFAFQIYVNRYNMVYYRTSNTNYEWTEWLCLLKTDNKLEVNGAPAEARTTGGLKMHDGKILRLDGTPDSIPVNENHIGYNEFISTTWDTLLPDNYQEGDEYDEQTTKILNIHVEKETKWQSTPYGTNQDTYPIHRYTFTPINGYQRTVMITSGCHGNEAEGYWGLYRLIRSIYLEGYKYPTLRNLRNVRFVIIPSWNPWGFQHYRRYNAFSALNTGTTDRARNLQAWNWLYAPNNQITIDGTVYDISDVGEAKVIWDTLNDYEGVLDLWMDCHTDPYAGRTTSAGQIDDPRGYTPPYGFYGFVRNGTSIRKRFVNIMEDFYCILKNEYNFTEKWHLLNISPDPSGNSGFATWMAGHDFPCALVEMSTFMQGFPHASGSAEMMKLAQEYYGNCLAEMACVNGW